MSQQRPVRRRQARQPDNTAGLTAVAVSAILASVIRAVIDWLLRQLPAAH